MRHCFLMLLFLGCGCQLFEPLEEDSDCPENLCRVEGTTCLEGALELQCVRVEGCLREVKTTACATGQTCLAGVGCASGAGELDMGADAALPNDGAATVDASTGEDDRADLSFAQAPQAPFGRGLQMLILGNEEFVTGRFKDDPATAGSFSLGQLIGPMASYQGWPTPQIEEVGVEATTLTAYQNDVRVKSFLSKKGWDVVVIQGPLDQASQDPEGFVRQMTDLAKTILSSSPKAHLILVEPRAEVADHPIYSTRFETPQQMHQLMQQLGQEVPERLLKELGPKASAHAVSIAPVGQAWLHALVRLEPLPVLNRERILFTEAFSPSLEGRYLMALVLYGVAFQRSVQGAKMIGIFTPGGIENVDLKFIHHALFATGAHDIVDEVTGLDIRGGPPPKAGLESLQPGERVLVDFGLSNRRSLEGGWNNIHPELGALSEVMAFDAKGQVLPVPRRVGIHLRGELVSANENGPKTTTSPISYPETATSDSFWLGDFGSHEKARLGQGIVDLMGLDPEGTYELTAFSSRMELDGAARLLLLSVGEQGMEEVQALNNVSDLVVFGDLRPDVKGTLTFRIRCSPKGKSKFAYLNTLELRRTK